MKKNQEEIIKEAKTLDWEYWLERPFGGFMISLFKGGNSRKSFEAIGVEAVEMDYWVSQNRVWYQSGRVWEKMEVKLAKYLSKGSVFDITKSLDKFSKGNRTRLRFLVKSRSISNDRKLEEFVGIMSQMTSFLWLAHGLEVYYSNRLKNEVPKYVSRNIDLFIGDATFPSKKNAHAKMEEMILQGQSAKKIVQKYGWLKIRDGFSEGFTEKDIKSIKAHKNEYKKISIPAPLRGLFKEVRELVYFRTYRTDVFYELIFIARPIIEETAKKYSLTFADLADYTIQSLIEGKPQKINLPFTAIGYKNDLIFVNKIIFNEHVGVQELTVKGMTAQRGVVRGRVRLVKSVADVDAVKNGDIMVARMTFPAYIMGMKRAAGFVTDEGGLTCHAAIVAREMKKPCIIGTKNATKVLKDGDLVEVDAVNGVVTKLK